MRKSIAAALVATTASLAACTKGHAESGGPTVGVPARRGFGSMLIQQNLARSLESEVELKFEHDGVNCKIIIPEPHLYSIEHAKESLSS